MHVKQLAVTKEKRINPIYDPNISLNLAEGGIDREQLLAVTSKEIVKTSTGKEILICEPTFKDNYDRLKKNAATIIPKDVGLIITECGMTKDTVILEAGSGSGALTCQLAALCKKVYTYDVNPKHLKLVKENCERLDLENVDLRVGDIYTTDDLPEEKVDVVVFDVPEPTQALATAKKVLKTGGYLVFYTPHISQVQDIYKALDEDFKYLSTIELLQRRWEVDEKRLRPKHAMLGHTAFLTFMRLFA